MMEAVSTSETSVENHFTRQYIPEDNSENHGKLFTSECDTVVAYCRLLYETGSEPNGMS
jgi:hypothetical protein